MTTELYKEAVIEARKLRKVAEEDAKNGIIKVISPYIKKVISEEVTSSSGGASSQFFFEQGEDELEAEEGLMPAPEGEIATDEEAIPTAAEEEGIGEEQPLAGEAPVAATGEEVISATVPDEEGKITVDVEDLFVEPAAEAGEEIAPPISAPEGTEGTIPTTPVAPPEEGAAEAVPGGEIEPEEELEPEEEEKGFGESAGYKKFEQFLYEVSEKIDHAYFKESINDSSEKALKQNLFKLLEFLDNLKDGGEINQKQTELNENKLEFLFLKLKEALEPNSYLKEGNKKEKIMTSLREYAAKLFEQEDAHPEKGDDKNTEHPTTASAKHAADVSGVSDELGGPEDIDVAASSVNEEVLAGSAGSVDAEPLPGTDTDPPAEEQWAEGEPSLDEKNQDKVIEEALDAIDEETEIEVDEKELAEAVLNIRKENIKRKMKELKEASDGTEKEGWEDVEPEGGKDPSHKNLKEGSQLEEQELEDVIEDEDEVGALPPVVGDEEEEPAMADMEEEIPGEGADLVLNIDLPDEAEEALADVDASILDDIDVELASVSLGEEPLEGMPGEEALDEVPPVEGGEEGAIEDEELEIVGDEGEEEEEVFESKKYKKRALKAESNLREANLFLAKNVYFTKFMQRGDLSRKNLGKIVEYLDNARSVAEAKKIYSKIKARLNEATGKASSKLAGSPSRVTKPGSAKTLTEGRKKRQIDPNDPVVSSVERWQKLANIKRRGNK